MSGGKLLKNGEAWPSQISVFFRWRDALCCFHSSMCLSTVSKHFNKPRFPHRPIAAILIALILASGAWAQDTNTYHTNRVFQKIVFTIPGIPTAFEVCDMAGKLTSVVGPTNVVTNSYYATEYQSIYIGSDSATQTWTALVVGYPSNSIVHTNHFYDNAGWIKGIQMDYGKWGGYIWYLKNTMIFKTSPTNIWVSTNGVTNAISRVLVGTIGDFAPMTDQSDTGPGIAEGLTNWPTPGGPSNDVRYKADFAAYYELANLPLVYIQPFLTNVCINFGNVTFTLGGATRVTNGVTWSIIPDGVTNGATLTGYPSNAVINVGSVATTYVVRATANENTNIHGSAILNVVKAGLPFQYKIGTNAWADMSDPLYVCSNSTVCFKATKIPTIAGWPSGKPVWGGVVSGSGKQTNSYTFNSISTSTSDYKIVTAECGNTVTGDVVVLNVELKVRHPQNPGPTGSPAKYTNDTPNVGCADNLFSTWLNEQFQVKVNIEPSELASSLPTGFITWSSVGFSISDNTTNYTFTWSTTGIKEVTVNFPLCGITKKIRVDIPDVGNYSETYALLNLVSAEAVAPIIAYGIEATDYCNTNYPVGPQRDAIRHAMWNALSVSSWLVSAAEIDAVTTGHEHDNRDNDHQQAFNSTMDLKNNDVGQTVNHSTSWGNPDRPAIRTDLDGKYSAGVMWIWVGGGAQENSEGILVKSDGIKIYPIN